MLTHKLAPAAFELPEVVWNEDFHERIFIIYRRFYPSGRPVNIEIVLEI